MNVNQTEDFPKKILGSFQSIVSNVVKTDSRSEVRFSLNICLEKWDIRTASTIDIFTACCWFNLEIM